MRRIIIYVCLFLGTSCYNQESEPSRKNSISLQTVSLPGLICTDWLDFQIFQEQDSVKVVYQDYLGFVIYNTLNNKIEDTLVVNDFGFQKVQNYHFVDRLNYVFQIDTTFLISINGNETLTSIALPRGVDCTKNGVIGLHPEEGIILFQVIDYRGPEGNKYNYKYLYSANLDGDWTPIEVKYPSLYEGGALSQPVVHLTNQKGYSLLSVNYEEASYRISASDLSVETINFPNQFDAEIIPKSDSEDRSQRMQAWTKRNNYAPMFGSMMYQEKDSSFYRFYFPQISDSKVNGKFLSYANRRIEIISADGTKSYTLPTKRYFLKNKWMIFDNILYYLKWAESPEGEEYYLLDQIQLNEY